MVTAVVTIEAICATHTQASVLENPGRWALLPQPRVQNQAPLNLRL